MLFLRAGEACHYKIGTMLHVVYIQHARPAGDGGAGLTPLSSLPAFWGAVSDELRLRAAIVFFYDAGGLPMQEDVEKRTMNVQATVVFDEAKLPELVHELVNPRPSGADHFRQNFLTDLRHHRLGGPFLAKAG
jgi:hypothetical protein